MADMTGRGAVQPARLSESQLAVTRQLLMHGPASRGRLGEILRMSQTSMSRLTRTLVEGGLVIEDPGQPGIGRPRQILSADPTARHVVGVKLTGTVAYGVACDMFGTVLSTRNAPLPSADEHGVVPVDATLRTVRQLVRQLAKRLPSLDGVGVALGGPVIDYRTVVEATFLGWRDVDLPAALGPLLEVPVVASNDVTALAREQLWFGAGRTHATFGVITLGAGIGFGVAREGVVLDQPIDNGHLLAHSPIDAHGPRCLLGHAGCTAAYLNRDDIRARAALKVRRPVTFAEIRSARDHGDPGMSRLLDDASKALGHLAATFAGGLQTERIVLAGEDVDALAGRTSPMWTVIDDRRRVRPGSAPVRPLDVSIARLTFTDWARGAAAVAIQHVLGALGG